MEKILVEKISYTEVSKNISQTEYEQTQEEYILSQSPEKYMISLPVRVLMFEGIEDNPQFTYYFYEEDGKDLFLMQRQRKAGVTHKTRYSLTREEADKILAGDFEFLLQSDEPTLNSLYFQFTVNQLHPTYQKTCIRKIFHQNRFLDEIVDISIERQPYVENEFFKASSKFHSIKSDNLRRSTRQYLNLSKPLEQLLDYQASIGSN